MITIFFLLKRGNVSRKMWRGPSHAGQEKRLCHSESRDVCLRLTTRQNKHDLCLRLITRQNKQDLFRRVQLIKRKSVTDGSVFHARGNVERPKETEIKKENASLASLIVESRTLEQSYSRCNRKCV